MVVSGEGSALVILSMMNKQRWPYLQFFFIKKWLHPLLFISFERSLYTTIPVCLSRSALAARRPRGWCARGNHTHRPEVQRGL